MSAVISECGKYRYKLIRDIPQLVRWVKPCLFIMLNPSTADATENDPTIRKCMAFANKWLCTRLTVVNLFAYRATDPNELESAEDAEGELNDGYLFDEVENHLKTGIIVAAWGAHKFARRRAEWVRNQLFQIECLGTNKDKSPKHPLFLSVKNTELEPWPQNIGGHVITIK